MADLSRLYTWLAGGIIKSSELTAELDALRNRLNDIEPDSLQSAAAEKLGLSQTGAVRRGKCILPGVDTRTNVAYGVMPTPDQVSGIVLPQDGLLKIAYSAMWKETVDGAARAAIFIGGNQLKLCQVGAPAPAAQEAACPGAANVYVPLSSAPYGLSTWLTASMSEATGFGGHVATGEAIGVTHTDNAYGFCHVFAAAGVYDISIRFKAAAGSVLVAERKLWVEAEGY